MAYYAKVRKADDMVVGTTVLNADQASRFPTNADVALQEITEAQYTTTRDGLIHPGSSIPRFRWTPAGFVNNPDTRPVVTFTPAEIKAEIGDAVTVEIALVGSGAVLREFVFGGVPIRIQFAAGKATISIDTSVPGQFIINSIEEFQVAAPLQVTVFSRKLSRKT